jgi:plastocyanin
VKRHALLAATVAILAVSACGVDGNDDYTSAVDEPSAAERRVPPTTTEPTVETGEEVAPTTTIAPAAPNGEVVEVRSLDNTYRVADIEIAAGTEVLWVNGGRNDHNVLPVDESQTWGIDTEDFTPGDEYRYLFDTPGTYLYYCSIHGTKAVGMVGSVTVVAPAV